jgi:hypothetical protein
VLPGETAMRLPPPIPTTSEPGTGLAQFIDTAGFAYVPDVIAARRAADAGVPEAVGLWPERGARDALMAALTPRIAEAVPDRLDSIVAELAEIQRACELALWAGRDPDREPGPHFIAGATLLRRLQPLIDAVAALRAEDEAARPLAVPDRTPLPAVPTGRLLALADLLPIVRPALLAARRLAKYARLGSRSEAGEEQPSEPAEQPRSPSPSGERVG